MYEKYIDVIYTSNLFNGIEKDDLKHIFNCFKYKIIKYKKGEYIALKDEKFNGIGIVLSGTVGILEEGYSGDRAIITMLKEGSTFGEVCAFSGEGLWPSSVQGVTDCSVLFLNPDKIVQYCNKGCSFHKIMSYNLIRIISEKAYLLHEKVQYLTIKSTRGRISKYIIKEYKKCGKLMFSLKLNREKLAFYLNITRPALSRELCKMRDEGIIEFYKDTIKILDIDKLKEIKF